ncbi:MGMT family protein [Kangiella sediminilitoris]|uniref:Methylated-DNA-(Protein)-cysteine S-methyltransferase DNA binding n=1 Tax=Kangiella sediminilitoris TaxID=1144748 RepID=A0A1B3BD06_9GAMM|nr:methylated-DNA--[protein]-cysteine S-methyltransferase [Kangiella sediminilitoris]AOE50633.1 Methylated-DNA-(Protein)-cysteine S-methyltransferase DNA binding [Kangiella sediminilitoris]
MTSRMDHFRQQVYYWVKKIPKGKVTSYGAIAKLAGFPRHARHVSKALGSAPDRKSLPWQRVIGADGKIAFHPDSDHYALQQTLLQKEGIRVINGKVDMKRFSWESPLQQSEHQTENNMRAEEFFR